jgi:methylated-DNA-[protein]-cysteine S-methyltransferase
MSNNTIVYWSPFHFKQWLLHVAVTDKGLCYVQFTKGDPMELNKWMKVHRPAHQLIEDESAILPYTEQLTRYMQGELTEFTMPLDPSGTPFQRMVWEALAQIPFGQTQSYSEIAAAINRSSAIRAVGTAIGANPILIVVPCHRVIGKNGTLTGYRGGLEAKLELLQLEQQKGTSLCSPA